MKKNHIALYLVFVLLLVLVTINCSKAPSDAQITSQVQAALNANSTLASKQISVQADAGTVSLSGNVGSETERTAAAKVASQVAGVKQVLNNLQVVAAAVPPPTPPAEISAPTSPKNSVPVAKSKPTGATKAASEKTATTVPQASHGTPASPPSVATLAPAPISVVIPRGTAVSIRLIDPVDTAKNKEGDTFRASLDAPIVVDGKTIVFKNADVEARLLSAKSAGHFTGSSSVVLVLTKITVGKTEYGIKTGEFTKQGASRGKRTAIVVGGGTAAGAVIGGIVGGGKGAAIGAAAGAAAGTGVQGMTQGQQLQLPAETLLEFQLAEPFTVNPKSTEGQGQ